MTLPATNGFALLPAVQKGTTRLAFKLWDEMRPGGPYHGAAKSLLAALKEGGARVDLLASEKSSAAAAALRSDVKFAPNGCEVHVVPATAFNSDYWLRDILLRATEIATGLPAATRTKNKEGFGKLRDWIIARFHLKQIDWPDILLDGGDSLVVDDRYWLLGAGSVSDMIRPQRGDPAWSQALAKIAHDVGRQPLVLGADSNTLSLTVRLLLSRVEEIAGLRKPGDPKGSQPAGEATVQMTTGADLSADLVPANGEKSEWAHADMVVAVTGKTDDDGSPIVLVAEPTAKICPQSKAATDAEEILGTIAKDLKAAGLKVIRNPAAYHQLGVLPYNNVIVQTDPDVVWLPTFGSDLEGMKAIDDENIRIWHDDLKFAKVIPVPGWSQLASEQQGCIRCATLPLPAT